MQKCGRCQFARYCSAACQQAHWPRHRRECRPLRDAFDGAHRRDYRQVFYGFLHEMDWRAFVFMIRNMPAEESQERRAALRNRGITVTHYERVEGKGSGKGKDGKGKNKGRPYMWSLREETIG